MIRRCRFLCSVLLIVAASVDAFAQVPSAPVGGDKQGLSPSHPPMFFPLPARSPMLRPMPLVRNGIVMPAKNQHIASLPPASMSAQDAPPLPSPAMTAQASALMTRQQAQQILSLFSAAGIE